MSGSLNRFGEPKIPSELE